ncbi:hypothetical protein WR25_04072 [Diploscapter pachys]|uniref:60S ribosomal protein L36 n=1 Tax=Diploscapter pachys TaxID=2018661 RepID=A0A2A2J5Q8_9BILA|nr:hypothetical protein WR25_04072 [Diploscapter pachys]
MCATPNTSSPSFTCNYDIQVCRYSGMGELLYLRTERHDGLFLFSLSLTSWRHFFLSKLGQLFEKKTLPMTQAGVEGLAVGLKKGHHVTKIDRKPKQSRHKGKGSKKTKVVRELVREVTGFAPYERRVLEMLRISKDKRALKFLKKRVGTHIRAKRKREEMQSVIIAQRKHHK